MADQTPKPESHDSREIPVGAGAVEIAPGVTVARSDLDFAASRSSGPGGQNVNKVNTRVELRIALAAIPIQPAARARLQRLAGRRVTADGQLMIVADEFRSQVRNKAAAMQRLRELVVQAQVKPKPRIATKPTKGSERRRVEAKKRRADTKKGRQHPGAGPEFD